MGDVKSYLNQNGLEISDFPISPKTIAELIQLVDDGKVSFSVASHKLFPALIETPTASPLDLATGMNLIQDSNEDSLLGYIETVKTNNPAEVERYKNGEKQLIGFFMGQLMKVSNGKADPKQSNQLLRKKLEE
jgi:aspartyl-tRNA(Asn)/glutamyl-tRNA(Gln) amidotransferase subunit B